MSKHTPGPWGIGHAAIITTNDDFGICTFVTPIKSQSQERQANARLIAAAPELLEALDSVVALHDYGYLDKGIGTETKDGKVWLSARAAITKAKGE